MMKIPVLLFILLFAFKLFSQGIIEADSVRAAFIGNGSRLTGLPNQNLAVSASGDTLHITEGNFVIIPGLSASNSGNIFANAGADIVSACATSFNLNASPLTPGNTGQWSVLAGTGGNLVNSTLPNALFIGQEGESYLLQWTVMHGGGSSSFDQLNISIATNTQTSVASAGADLFAIMTQSVILNGNAPETESNGRWEILNGIGGLISDVANPTATFTGVPGQSYTLRWQHYNDCSTSSDEVVLTFSESASGVPSANGRYFIPDPVFRQFLQIVFPSIMDGDSLIVAMGGQVKKLNLTNLNVQNLDGLQYLIELESFVATSGPFASIPFFSEKLKRFDCTFCNNLTILPEFPLSLDTIYGQGWRVSSIPSFPPGLRKLDLLAMYKISSFPVFPDSCEDITLDQIGGCCPGDFVTGTLNIPNNCKYFQVGDTALDNFPSLPTDPANLERLTLNNCTLTTMPSLYNMTNLESLNLERNSLAVLDSIPFLLQYISIGGNPLICVKNKPPLVEDQLTDYIICPE